MNKNELRLISIIDPLWTEIRGYAKEIIELFSGGKSINDYRMIRLITISMKIVTGELVLKKNYYKHFFISQENYKKYVKYGIHEVLIGPVFEEMDWNDGDEKMCLEFIEQIRNEMWGYIKKYQRKLCDILIKGSQGKKELTKRENALIIDCIFIAFTESLFRKKELYFLERKFN